MNYEKKYLKYKLKYFSEKKSQTGGVIPKSLIPIVGQSILITEFASEEAGHDQPFTDHHVLKQRIEFNGESILLLSLNIAQKFIFKTDQVNDEFNCFLRSKTSLSDPSGLFNDLKRELDDSSLNGIYAQHVAGLLQIPIPEGRNQVTLDISSDRTVHDRIIKIIERFPDIKKILVQCLGNIKIVLKKNDTSDITSKYRNGIFIEVSIEENDYQYQRRIKHGLDFLHLVGLNEIDGGIDNVLIFIQENNPSHLFIPAYNESKLREKGFMHFDPRIIDTTGKSTSELLYRLRPDSRVRINPDPTHDTVPPSMIKGPKQTWSFILEVGDKLMKIYNCHSGMIWGDDAYQQFIDKWTRAGNFQKAQGERRMHERKKKAVEFCITELIPKLKQEHPVVFIGDFNFGLSEKDLYDLTLLFRNESIYSYFLATPEMGYTEIRANPTYDCIFARGIKICY